MTAAELREKYAAVFGEPAASGNRAWLGRRVGWRMLAQGGEDEPGDSRLWPTASTDTAGPIGRDDVRPSRPSADARLAELSCGAGGLGGRATIGLPAARDRGVRNRPRAR